MHMLHMYIHVEQQITYDILYYVRVYLEICMHSDMTTRTHTGTSDIHAGQVLGRDQNRAKVCNSPQLPGRERGAAAHARKGSGCGSRRVSCPAIRMWVTLDWGTQNGANLKFEGSMGYFPDKSNELSQVCFPKF